MKKPRTTLILENVEIASAVAEGKSIARVDNMVVFVSNAVPGDVVDIQVTRKKKRYAEGKAIHFHHQSDKRTKPACEHFGVCGGCKWQHLGYQWQLHFKQQQVLDSLERLGGIALPPLQPILGSEKVYYYRNRLDYSFSNKRWLTNEEVESGAAFDQQNRNALGFHIPGTFDKVLHVNHCHLQEEPSDSIRLFVKAFSDEHGFSFFDIRNKTGLLRNLIVRTASTGGIMVLVVFCDDEPESHQLLLQALRDKFPQITSLMYVVNPKANDTIGDLDIQLFHGNDHIIEAMEDLRFKVGPKSFYQTNSAQAYVLYKVAREFAGLTGSETVYDLYTGTGTIAQFVAKQAKKVIGVEYVEAAIADARENAAMNGITNCKFFAADMKDIFNAAFLSENGSPDVIITDPPRAGMHEDVVRCIATSGAKKVVYVSCNPASQARDLALLDAAYKVTRVQPVDMFPHTHHVENVVLLEKRDEVS
ncbi:MAG: 23S rRNA (uracil1939-C5)-methyltransferase [Bacteroidetes bacterium]|nr:MAG: 23S rRNA (uracil1939-C5)-methyltransferase [Bacteroidota bacterium]